MPGAADAVPAAEGDGNVEGETGVTGAEERGEATGVAAAPGCVAGCALCGFVLAGWARFSDFRAAGETDFGVALACGDGAAVAAGAAGVAIG